MARFANDCLEALAPLLRKLERELGKSMQGHRDAPGPIVLMPLSYRA